MKHCIGYEGGRCNEFEHFENEIKSIFNNLLNSGIIPIKGDIIIVEDETWDSDFKIIERAFCKDEIHFTLDSF